MAFFGTIIKQWQRLRSACRSGRLRVRLQSRLFLSPDRGKFPPLRLASVRAFPPPLKTDARPHALLAVGGALTAERLLAAYAQGIYPVYLDNQLHWIIFNPRMVLFFEKTKVEKNVRRLIRSGQHRLTFDTAFERVVRECSRRKWTWLVPERIAVAAALHRQGRAHSVEVWNRQGELVGGAFGTDMGHIFIGESVFHRESNAGKAALVCLYCHLQHWGYEMADAQAYTRYLAFMGFEEISSRDFVKRIRKPQERAVRPGRWAVDDQLDVAGWVPASPGRQIRRALGREQKGR